MVKSTTARYLKTIFLKMLTFLEEDILHSPFTQTVFGSIVIHTSRYLLIFLIRLPIKSFSPLASVRGLQQLIHLSLLKNYFFTYISGKTLTLFSLYLLLCILLKFLYDTKKKHHHLIPDAECSPQCLTTTRHQQY